MRWSHSKSRLIVECVFANLTNEGDRNLIGSLSSLAQAITQHTKSPCKPPGKNCYHICSTELSDSEGDSLDIMSASKGDLQDSSNQERELLCHQNHYTFDLLIASNNSQPPDKYDHSTCIFEMPAYKGDNWNTMSTSQKIEDPISTYKTRSTSIREGEEETSMDKPQSISLCEGDYSSESSASEGDCVDIISASEGESKVDEELKIENSTMSICNRGIARAWNPASEKRTIILFFVFASAFKSASESAGQAIFNSLLTNSSLCDGDTVKKRQSQILAYKIH